MYYMCTYGDKDKTIPFEFVKENNEHHTLLKSISYPSEYGMSRPFNISEYNKDLEKCEVSWGYVVRWVESRPIFADTVMAAHKGNQRAKNILKEWDEVKRSHR